MKKRRVLLNATLLMLFLGLVMPQNAQDVPTSAERSNQPRRMVAINVLRTINTAEFLEQSTHGSFASWETLLERHSQYFDEFIAMHGQQIGTAHFANPPEILPGLKLRLSVHINGQGYDVLLEDTADKTGYAVLSDERAVIRECKWI